MDKKLLQALDNIGDGLEALVDALNNKQESTTSTGAAIKAGNFGKQLEEINVSIKSIKADTQEILKNQQTIIALSKKKENDKKTEEFEGASDPKKESAIKKGVATILLIAVAVLAIGLAFKLVGNVNVLSVVGLAIAITLISIAFEKVASLKLSIKEAFNTSAAMIIMSVAVTASSWTLSKITPISLVQILTIAGIAGAFAIIGLSLERIAIGVSRFHEILGNKASWIAPMMLVAVATAITASSWVMSNITPIGLSQGITAILISGTFALIGYNLEKIAEGVAIFHKILGNKAVWVTPLILVAIATAITASSWIMSLIKPIGLTQALTGIVISAMFMIIGFTMLKIAESIVILDKLLGKSASWILPLMLVAIATAITASSWIMSLINPIGIGQFLTALGISILFGLISFFIPSIAIGIKVLDKTLGKGASFMMPLMFVSLSLAIMLSSHILAETADIDLAKIFKIAIFGVALALMILAMTPGVVILGIALKTLGIANMIIAAIMIPVLAGAIAISSLILGIGDYKTFPSLQWTLGVGAAFLSFSVSLVALGALALTGIGAAAFFVGIPLALSLAATIVGVSKILKNGDYNLPGIMDWALGVSLLYATFTPILLVLGAVGLASSVLSFFGANPWEMAKGMLLEIADTIVGVSHRLKKGDYKGGPTEEWAKGVAISIGAFSLVYDMLADSKSLFFAGPSPQEFTSAIITVVSGIITSANMLANTSVAFKNGPPVKWAKGVGEAIGAFAPVYDILVANSGWFSSGVSVKDFKKAIMTISQGIVDAAEFFAKNTAPFSEGNYPSARWGKGVGAALNAFAPVFKSLSEDTGWFTSGDEVIHNMVNGITRMSFAIVRVAKILSGGKKYFNLEINPNFIKGVGKNMIDFNELVSKLREDDEGYFTWLESMNSFEGNDPILKLAGRMNILAKGYDALATSLVKLGNAMKVLNIKNNKELPFLGEDSLLRSNKKLNPEISIPSKKEMSKVGEVDGKKVVGLRPTPTTKDENPILQKLDKIEKGISMMVSSSTKTSSIIDKLYKSTSEYHDTWDEKFGKGENK